MNVDFAARLQSASLQIFPFLMAVVFHEVGHGWAAKWWGDNTAEAQGRLTLNPIPHIDPIGTLLFPILNMVTGIPLFIGWAKPVPINPSRFRKYRPGLFCVSLAGITANFCLAVFFALMSVLTLRFVNQDAFFYEPLVSMGYVGIQINFALALFNLIPLPPLDGGKVVESLLSYNQARAFAQIERYGFIILLVLFMTGAISYVLGPPIQFLTRGLLNLVGGAFGLA